MLWMLVDQGFRRVQLQIEIAGGRQVSDDGDRMFEAEVEKLRREGLLRGRHVHGGRRGQQLLFREMRRRRRRRKGITRGARLVEDRGSNVAAARAQLLAGLDELRRRHLNTIRY